ncbi:MAG: hemolysin family protein [Desulfobulbaceae bacterium]|jgi:CBS domain containing-hemolysin-like protein|nr:hemolysin family protein [Desulfobulbaceae bacterium]HKJ15221.1 hemolysin family protein [Desulfobulbales bacterium]MDH3541542.1 hemolysin family protein [Desulfobulbaceae bacterium]MDH3781627.1 hemolysin family protein [Desulfobulbaceae bacterium]MDH3995986.1 hemolysin family protein [Desulfobulbaceae bacterium]
MEKDQDSSSDLPDPQPSKNILIRLLDILGLSRSPDTTEDLEMEIQELLEEGEEQGLITHQEGQMISSIFEFRDTLIHEIMTPRPEMVCADVKIGVPEVLKLITREGFTRIPVYSESQDNIIGILNAKDLLVCVDAPETCPDIKKLIKPPYFVPETMRIVDLLKAFQAKKNHMAIVTDEFGGVRGLITLEDVLEEIVGEIDDEYDKDEPQWRALQDGSLMIYAKEDVEDVESFFAIKLPEGPYESVGGFIIHQLGHLPKAGEIVELDTLTFKVVSATKRHIKTVKIQRK